ncbi:DUF4354 family protein [Zymobacter palmae]|uniref:D-alanyl-D-alanine carboxypeptidase n=1 Tax=Zymobacter palmae TaxID=33074 RepID=A0A348HI30_9GAMM|nr:DUF4354 family protein [Zymobacter palmae]BBG31282.1 D-alanyl-D-alanine carboxypeptidase [Zymobacter palmae]
MLKRNGILAIMLSMMVGSAVAATPADSVMVIASPDGTQTTTQGTTTYFTRLFEVSLTNVGHQPVDLAHGCFKAYDRRGTSYSLDIAEEGLLKGMLKPGLHKKGDMGFSSLQPDVYDADVIRFSTDCPRQ